MTTSPQSELPALSDRQDLAELAKGVKRYTGFDEYAIPEFFATDKGQPESAPSVRTERGGGLD